MASFPLQWCTPEGMLQDYSTGAVFLAPPQVYETSRLLNVTSFAELSQFASRRAAEGCEQWMPVIASASDGAVSLLPGQFAWARMPAEAPVQRTRAGIEETTEARRLTSLSEADFPEPAFLHAAGAAGQKENTPRGIVCGIPG